jgi:hypothetical protein
MKSPSPHLMKNNLKSLITNAPIVRIASPLCTAKLKIYFFVTLAAQNITSPNWWQLTNLNPSTKWTLWVTARTTTRNWSFTASSAPNTFASNVFRKESIIKTWSIPSTTSVSCTKKNDNWLKISSENPKKNSIP